MGRSCVVPWMRISASRAVHSELLVEVHPVDEGATGEEVAFDVLDPALDLPLRSSPVRGAQPRLAPPVVGEGLEGGVPAHLVALAAGADGPRPVVEVLPGVAAEVLEGLLVGLEQAREPRSSGLAQIETAARQPQGEHEEVLVPTGPRLKMHPCLTPVDLALQPRRRLKARHGCAPRASGAGPPKRTDEDLDGVIAALEATLPNQFLVQNPRRVVHVWGAAAKKFRVRREHRGHPRRLVHSASTDP